MLCTGVGIHCRSRVRNILVGHNFGIYCKADIFLHIPWYAKHFSTFVENKYPIKFDYTEFLILVNPSTNKPGYWQICVWYILARNASPRDRDEVKTDLMLAAMKNKIFPLISITDLLKVLTLCYQVHLEMLVLIYWNSWVALKCQREKSIDASQLYKIMVVM